MPEPSHETQRPHFVLDEVENETARQDLTAFQEVVFTDPMGVAHALEVTEPDAASAKYEAGIALATSLDAAPDYDEPTTRQIRMSDTIAQLQYRRKQNERNHDVSLELAADLRKERLRIFVQRVLKYSEDEPTADVVPLPDTSATGSRRSIRRVDGRAS